MAKSWRLITLDGDSNGPNFGTRMDIDFTDEGRVAEVAHTEWLDQRFRVAVTAKRGRRPLAPSFGFVSQNLVGSKALLGQEESFITSNLIRMVAGLIQSQNELASRVPLAPDETMVQLSSVQVEPLTATTFKVSTDIQTQEGSVPATFTV
jgi:hypothetical protein